MFRNRKSKKQPSSIPQFAPAVIYGSPTIKTVVEPTIINEKVDLIDLAHKIKEGKERLLEMKKSGYSKREKRTQKLMVNKLVTKFNNTVGFYSVDYSY